MIAFRLSYQQAMIFMTNEYAKQNNKGSIWRIPLFQIHYYKHKNVIIYEKNSLFHVDSHGDKVGEERMDKLSAKPPFCPYFYYILCEG